MTSENESLAGLTPEEIAARFALEPYRARQIFLWIAKGARGFEEMANIPLALRERLAETASLYTARCAAHVRARDGTIKLRLVFPGKTGESQTAGSAAAETVILSGEAGRETVCLSSQAGCPLGCAFCQTGQLGFARNLRAAEIVEQFLTARDSCGAPPERRGNVVFMGMGEPLLNFDEVKKAVCILTHKDGIALSARRITISTAGVTSGIYRLADEMPQTRLAVSVTACDETLRARLMPGLAGQPLAGLKQAIIYWKNKTGKRCTLEAALFSGVNTSAADMRRLAAFARETGAHVNLIPWNPVPGLPFSRPKKDEIAASLAALKAEGANATLRLSRGGSVAGACGQLGER